MTGTSEYPLFKDLGGDTWRILRFPDEKDKTWSAFNPSISYSPVGGYVVLFRSSNYFFDPVGGHAVLASGNRVKSRMWLGNLDKNFQLVVESLREIAFTDCGMSFKRGAEDGRLFWRDNAWHFTAGLKEDSVPLPRIGLFRLDDGLNAKLIEVMDSDGLMDVEKNWMAPYVANPKFDYVYSSTKVYKDGLIKVRESSKSLPEIRGGSPLWLMEDGSYLTIVHASHNEKQYRYNPRSFGYGKFNVRTYTHMFATYSSAGVLTGLSNEFVFEHLGVEFAAGLVISDSDVVVSYGYKDVASYLGRIPLENVLEMIKNV
jgi:hypothetical protein